MPTSVEYDGGLPIQIISTTLVSGRRNTAKTVKFGLDNEQIWSCSPRWKGSLKHQKLGIRRQPQLISPTNEMKKDCSIVVVGAGVFGLTTALELALQGYSNITVLDRHVPPVRRKRCLTTDMDSSNPPI